jgi:hypothetical protein
MGNELVDLSREQQLAIIDRQIADWNEVRYNAEIAGKVHARIGLGDQAKAYAERVMQAMRAITVLGEMRAELTPKPDDS